MEAGISLGQFDQSCQLDTFLGQREDTVAYAANIDCLCEPAQGRGSSFEVFCPVHAGNGRCLDFAAGESQSSSRSIS
jgi:hypothetical protein